MNAADFGVPQRRERVFFVGFREDVNVSWNFPLATHSQEALFWDQVRGDYWERHGVSKKLQAGKRLDRHAHTIQHRSNLNPSEVSFKAVRVFRFTAIDLETQLIRHYGTIAPVTWNFSGFGSNDPGRERDTTNLRPEGFDANYPIDIDRQLEIVLPETGTAASIITALKELYALHVPCRGAEPRKSSTAPRLLRPPK